MSTDLVRLLQEMLLRKRRNDFPEFPILESTQRAFMAVRRHHFVERYKPWGETRWRQLGDGPLESHLGLVYSDYSLILREDADGRPASTISQPSLVLYMLDLLGAMPGDRIFELGTGSGWNAALLAHVAGPHGLVFTCEFDEELAAASRDKLRQLDVRNAFVHAGDGLQAAAGQSYDRAMFTAAASGIPGVFFDCIRPEGRLVAVVTLGNGEDVMLALRKVGRTFESETVRHCCFVPARRDTAGCAPASQAAALDLREASDRAFWWGGSGSRPPFKTTGMRLFLMFTEPELSFAGTAVGSCGGPVACWGLRDPVGGDFAAFAQDALFARGASELAQRLWRRIHEWVDLGMPGPECYRVRALPEDGPMDVGPNEWILRRDGGALVWTLADATR